MPGKPPILITAPPGRSQVWIAQLPARFRTRRFGRRMGGESVTPCTAEVRTRKNLAVTVTVPHADAEVAIDVLVIAAERESRTLTLQVTVDAPNTQVEVRIRSAVFAPAAASCTACLRLTAAATGTDAQLTHRSLLIGAGAKSRSDPYLEIETNQVQCSHAASITTLDPESLFALAARGIDPETASELLIQAFLRS